MLLSTVLMWSLNITVSKYLIGHGWGPLTYVVLRNVGGILLFAAFTFGRERSFRIGRGDLWLVGLAAAAIFLNQWVFGYAIKYTTASTFALILATAPVFVGLLTGALGLERLGRRFWAAAAVTFAGVALVAAAEGGFSGGRKGILLALCVPLTWSAYSMAIAPLMQSYSALRLSTVVLAIGSLPLVAVGPGQLAAQDYSFGALLWFGFAYSVVGALFLTNILWFTAIDRVGAARATLFVNMQPFFAVVFALILLSEHLYRLQIAGGLLIFAGIALDRIRPRSPPAQPPR